MKTLHYLVSILLLAGCFFACNDDDHYDPKEIVINNKDVEVVDMQIIEYLKSQSTYSAMTKLFEEAGIFSKMEAEGLQYTMFVVPDELVGELPTVNVINEEDAGTDEATFLARTHISSSPLSPNTIKTSTRVLAWNGKYVVVSLSGGENEEDNMEPIEEKITFLGSPLSRIIKANNGFIYELESVLVAPKSLLETIEFLPDDEYSIFKEMILGKNELTFDKEASTPTGVDASGNTIYDSVFITTNPYFLHQGEDLSNEAKSYTMLIPSNELITNAIADAKTRMNNWWGDDPNLAALMHREDSILYNWCFQVAFYKKKLYREDFENNIDLEHSGTNGSTGLPRFAQSIFDKQWRTTVNEVDLDNPIEMSNGIAYYMTKLKIPQNVLIWRVKDHFKYYGNNYGLSETDKENHFTLTNLYCNTGNSRTDGQYSAPGRGWPEIHYEYVQLRLEDTSVLDATVEYTAFNYEAHDNGTYTIIDYRLPPGEYTLSFGCCQYTRMVGYWNVWLNGEQVVDQFTGVANLNRDRTGIGYPEFYPYSLDGNYDRDGAVLATLTIPGNEYDRAVPIVLKIQAVNCSGDWSLPLSHWCMRPTINCY